MTNTLKEAALSAPRVEPVAWRCRRKGSIGGDTTWTMCPLKPERDHEFELQPLYAAPPSQPDTPARRQADIVAGAMAIARSRGHDPEEPAPLTEMCTEDNAPVPWWMVFVEESEACLTAVSYAAQPDAGVRAAISELIQLAAECHRTKWQFDFNDEKRLSVGMARDMVKRAFEELHRIGDLALKAKSALAAHAVPPDAVREDK